MTLDRAAYLHRVAIETPAATEDGLAALQEAQLKAIAFESIDPLTGIVPDLSSAALHDKILTRGRGGYCFELNGLFGAALKAFGISARPVMARVRKPAPGPRSHLAFVVTLDGRDWLADTGFGGPGARLPVLIEPGRIAEQGHDAYRMMIDEDRGETVLQKREAEGWIDLYGFDAMRVMPVDLEAANHVCATWAGMPFSSHLMLNRLTEEGRLSAFDLAVSQVHEGEKTSRRIETAEELGALLRTGFGLTLSDAQIAAVADRLGLGETASLRSKDAVLPA